MPGPLPIITVQPGADKSKAKKRVPVDTSAIFKVTKRRKEKAKGREAKAQIATKVAEPKKNDAELDVVAEQLEESLTATADYLYNRTVSAIERTHSNLIAQLADISLASEASREQREHVAKVLHKPLQDEKLSFRGANGTSTDPITLGERIDRHRKKTETAKEKLDLLLPEVKKLDGEVERLWMEIVKDLGWNRKEEEKQVTRGQGSRLHGDDKVKDEMKEWRAKWEDDIDKAAASLLEKMEISETKVKIVLKRVPGREEKIPRIKSSKHEVVIE